MSAPEKKNLAASVRQRLLVLSQKRIVLSDDFPKMKSVQWSAFLRKSKLPQLEMATVIDSCSPW